ncbi:MAG: hypothetical protein HYX75_16290 [Acidobacteria bacterium]|nr:hypothetical protein [Acidobacteriota bacterium]
MRVHEEHFQEEHVEHSNALHSAIRDRGGCLVGPLARYNLNYDRLPAIAREAAPSVGLSPICKNPFKSVVVRAIALARALGSLPKALTIYGIEGSTFEAGAALSQPVRDAAQKLKDLILSRLAGESGVFSSIRTRSA